MSVELGGHGIRQSIEDLKAQFGEGLWVQQEMFSNTRAELQALQTELGAQREMIVNAWAVLGSSMTGKRGPENASTRAQTSREVGQCTPVVNALVDAAREQSIQNPSGFGGVQTPSIYLTPAGGANPAVYLSKSEQGNVRVATAEQKIFSPSLSTMTERAQTGRKAPENAPIQTQFTSNQKVLVSNTDSEDSDEQSSDRKRSKKRASSRCRARKAGKDPVDSDSRGRSKTKAGKDPAESVDRKQTVTSSRARTREVLSCDHFIDALADKDLILKIRERRPRDLDTALQIALELEVWAQDSERFAQNTGRAPQSDTKQVREFTRLDEQGRDPVEIQDELGEHRKLVEKLFDEFQKTLAELKVSTQVDTPWQTQGRAPFYCWGCGQQGHTVKNCPEHESNVAQNDEYRKASTVAAQQNINAQAEPASAAPPQYVRPRSSEWEANEDMYTSKISSP